jgi:hypothetical protein
MCFFFSLSGARDVIAPRRFVCMDPLPARCVWPGDIGLIVTYFASRTLSRTSPHYAVIVQCFMAVLCCALLSEAMR